MLLYIAQANIGSEILDIRKGGSVTQDVYDSLPKNLKIKFIPAFQPPEPKGRNKIIGDSPAEKIKRDKLFREDELKKKNNKRTKEIKGK